MTDTPTPPAPAGLHEEPSPIERLKLYLTNRGAVSRRQGFTAMADDYAEQLAALNELASDRDRLARELAKMESQRNLARAALAGVKGERK